MINFTYQVNLCSPFVVNEAYLNELYLPIIGNDVVNLYKLLKYEQQNNLDLFAENQTHEKLLKKLGISWEQFVIQRKKLEAVDLLKTYVNKTTQTYYYVLNEPLSFEELSSNAKLFSILRNRTTHEEFKKIKVKFDQFMQLSNMLDVSETIDYLITETESRDLFLFNFEKLYATLAKKYHVNFVFEHDTKKIIDDLFNENIQELETIYDLVEKSIILVKGQYIVSEQILKEKVDEYKFKQQELEIIKRTSIKRNYKIFNKNEDIKQFADVIKDYKKHSAENYIVISTKKCISSNIKNLINQLRNQYNFNDSFINVIIDYTNIKNKGNIVPNFVTAIANTVNSLALNTTEEVIEHLRNWPEHKKINNVYSVINSQLDKAEQVINNTQLENEFNFADYDEEQLDIIKSIG